MYYKDKKTKFILTPVHSLALSFTKQESLDNDFWDDEHYVWIRIHKHTHSHSFIIFNRKAYGIVSTRVLPNTQKQYDVYIKRFIARNRLKIVRAGEAILKFKEGLQEGETGTPEHKGMEAVTHR